MKISSSILIIICVFTCFPFTFAQVSDFRVPLTVKEALPKDVEGVDRPVAPVTIGVPLPESSGITSIDTLKVLGAARGQFKPIGRWPNGNLRWVVVDTITSLKAGASNDSLVLSNGGQGNFGGESLATDVGEFININCGVARFQLRKQNFNFFDSVVVGKSQLVTAGNSGSILLQDSDNQVYSSANDKNSSLVIEENGPIKAIIRAKGRFAKPSGETLMGYKARLTFYYGLSRVKAVITLCNTCKDAPSMQTFNSLEVQVPTTLRNDLQVAFGCPEGDVQSPLKETAYLFQGYSTYKWQRNADFSIWKPPVPMTKDWKFDAAYGGYKLEVDGVNRHQLGNIDDHGSGWVELHGRGQGVSISFPWMGGYWPASLEASADGVMVAGLYSRHSSIGGYRFPFYGQDAREIHFDFHEGDFDNVKFNIAAHYPVVGKAPWGHYVATRCLFGQSEFVTPAEQASFFKGVGYDFAANSSSGNTPFHSVTRAWQWAAGGGANQGDYVWGGSILDWLRTGYGGAYLRSRDRATYLINLGTLRTDWDYSKETVKPHNPKNQLVVFNALANPPQVVEMEHHQIATAIWWYFLTGDEEAAEFVKNDLQVNLHDNPRGIWTTGMRNDSLNRGMIYLRAWSRKLRNMAYQWEWSFMMGNPEDTLLRYVENCMAAILDEVAVPAVDGKGGNRGRSKTRGFYVGDSSSYNTIHSFFYTQIQFEALYQVYRILQTYHPDYPRLADIEEMLGGMAQFFYQEYFYAEATDGRYWQYNYPLYQVWQPPEKGMISYPADRAAVWGYIYDGGDKTYLQRGAQAFAAYQYSAIGSGPLRARGESYNWFSELQAQALMHAVQVQTPRQT